MKSISHRVSFLLFLLIFSLTQINRVSAVGYTDYETNYASVDECSAFLTAISFDSLDSKEDISAISCFAISNDGIIALGSDVSSNAVINVFDANGQFLYGYSFLNNHCAFTIFFEGENLSIFWLKNKYIGSFDSAGNCLLFRKAVSSSSNFEAYDNESQRPENGTVGTLKYYAKRGLGLKTSYVQFVVEDSDGNQRVICDVTDAYNTRLTGYGIVLVAISAIVIMSVFINNKNRHRDQV